MVLVEDDGSVVALAGAVGEWEVEAAVDMIVVDDFLVIWETKAR